MCKYTEEEIRQGAIVMARMLPYRLQGMTIEQAGQALLKRDRELTELALSDTPEGKVLNDYLVREIYDEIRRKEEAKKNKTNI